MNKERRLGRGLEALLGQLPARNEPALPAQQPSAGSRVGVAARGQPLRRAGHACGAIGRGTVPAGRAARGARPVRRSAAPSAGSCSRSLRRLSSAAERGHWPSQCHRPRGSTSARSTATRPSRGRTSPPTRCNRWPRAFRPTGCCSRSLCGGCMSGTSWSPASGGFGRQSRPAGSTCRST